MSTTTTSTEKEVWFRNPHSYIRECVLGGVRRVIWDRGVLRKLGIDPQRHAAHHYPITQDFLVAAIGDQGMAVMDRQHGWWDPLAVYPVWEYGQQDLDELERWMADDCTEELRARAIWLDRPPDEVPVLGQRHMVAVIRPPSLGSGVGLQFFGLLQDLQADYPDCVLHVHGIYSYPKLFGSNIRSVDIDARFRASMGEVQFPNGRRVKQEHAWRHRKWLDLLGFSTADLSIPRKRCLFAIKAAQWAAEHWDDEVVFGSTTDRLGPSGLAAVVNGRIPGQRPVRSNRTRAGYELPGDKLYCGACSLADSCRSYREGSVCSVSGTDAEKLAKLFNTRDSDQIIKGLSALMEGDLERLEEGRRQEQDDGELSPHVTKLTDNLFRHGTALAKLVDPSLRSAAVAINLNGGGPVSIEGGKTPQALAADAVQALEAGGVPRDQITGEMVQKCLEAGGDETDLQLIIASAAAKYALPPSFFGGATTEDETVIDP